MCSDPLRFRPSFAQSTRCAALALLLLAPFAAGCGKKGDPRPAPRTIPQTISDLAVRQRGLEVVAEMTHPQSTVAGLTLSGLDEVVLFELQRPGSAPLASAPAPTAPAPTGEPLPPTPGGASTASETPTLAAVPAAPIALPEAREFELSAKPLLRIGGAELASAISGDRITLRFRLPEPLPQPAPLRFYAVRTLATGGEASAFSNLVALAPREVPAAPGEFRIGAKKEGVELTWQSGPSSLAGWNVYRRAAEMTGYGAPLLQLAPAETTTLDRTAAYGKSYIYAVTAVAAREPLVESALSIEREVVYDDRFAPIAPTGLAALPGAGEVRLVWEAVAEPDVAGYLVERAQPGSEEFHRIGGGTVTGLELVDRGLGSGFVFRYRVAAIDRAGNPGPFSPAVDARVP